MPAEEKKEIIICAAIKTECGQVFRGHRHCHCINVMKDVLSWDMTREQIIKTEHEEGFITSKNRYVDRKEAYKLQISAGIKSVNKGGYWAAAKELYSEDLY